MITMVMVMMKLMMMVVVVVVVKMTTLMMMIMMMMFLLPSSCTTGVLCVNKLKLSVSQINKTSIAGGITECNYKDGTLEIRCWQSGRRRQITL
jgi:hypothetical protein